MTILDDINSLIQEAYVFSDKTISVGLDEFESGEKDKLFVVGLSGGGKTTLGLYLAKKYNAKYVDTDDIHIKFDHYKEKEYKKHKEKVWEEFNRIVNSNERLVIGGVGIGFAWENNEVPENQLLDIPVIFLGKSILKSSWDASGRDNKGRSLKGKNRLRQFYVFMKWNIQRFHKRTEEYKKAKIKNGGNVEEFKVPKL
jgi:shikimate kinase